MKCMNLCHYVSDLRKVAALRPAHSAYMADLDGRGMLWAAGPLVDGHGGLFIYEANTMEEALSVFHDDPYFVGGAVKAHEIAAWDAALYKTVLGRP